MERFDDCEHCVMSFEWAEAGYFSEGARSTVLINNGFWRSVKTLASRRVRVRAEAPVVAFGVGGKFKHLVTTHNFTIPLIISSRGEGNLCRVLVLCITVQIFRFITLESPEGAKLFSLVKVKIFASASVCITFSALIAPKCCVTNSGNPG